MRLALALGYASVNRMLAEMSSAELTEWIEFYGLEPFGEERSDWRSAIAASAICNSFGAKTKPKDFIPDFGPEKPKTHNDIVRQFMLAGAIIKPRE